MMIYELIHPNTGTVSFKYSEYLKLFFFFFFSGWLIKIGMIWRKKIRICNGIVNYYVFFKLFMFFCLLEPYCKLWYIPQLLILPLEMTLSKVSLRSYISSTLCNRCPSNFSWWQTSWNINRFCEWSLMSPYLEDNTYNLPLVPNRGVPRTLFNAFQWQCWVSDQMCLIM